MFTKAFASFYFKSNFDFILGIFSFIIFKNFKKINPFYKKPIPTITCFFKFKVTFVL